MFEVSEKFTYIFKTVYLFVFFFFKIVMDYRKGQNLFLRNFK